MRSLWLDINRSLKDETSRQSRIERALFSEVRETKTNKHTQKKSRVLFQRFIHAFFSFLFKKHTESKHIIHYKSLYWISSIVIHLFMPIMFCVCVCLAHQICGTAAIITSQSLKSISAQFDLCPRLLFFFFLLTIMRRNTKHSMSYCSCPLFFFLHKLWLRPCVHYSYESLKDSVNQRERFVQISNNIVAV